MLQNRVDPMGNIITTPARGRWMGTRGILHNDQQQIIRPFKLHTWITCQLEFKGRQRKVMTPKRFTELFFMDEATAFSAGHRPCAECRRDDYNRFKMFWLAGNSQFNFNKKTRVQYIDAVLQQERIDSGKCKITYPERVEQLPDGAFVSINDAAYLVYDHQLYKWSPAGYAAPVPFPALTEVAVLTPRSIVHALAAGYKPQMNITVQ